MKSSLKLFLAAVLLSLPVANLLRAADEAAPAQPAQSTPPSSGDKPQRQRMTPEQTLQSLSEKLSLTDDQKTKILPILQAQADQQSALRKDTSLSDEDKRDKRNSITQATRTQIGALLTPEQLEKYKSMRTGRGDRSGGNPPPPANNPPPPPAPTT